MSSAISIDEVSFRYPGKDTFALQNVSLRVPAGETLALIGASGSGKSTLLRMLAGFEKPRSGSIFLGDRKVSGGAVHVAPEKREIGLVSQGGDLFPHLTVLKNVLYGLGKVAARERRGRAMEALEMVNLEGLAQRFPSDLSGGEAQRVAIARALAPRPQVILLDEPFSSLDTFLRDRLRELTADLLRRANVTTVIVTHHGEDALSLGDRIGVMEGGRLLQHGEPLEIYNRPVNAQVAALLGPINLLETPMGNRLVRPGQLAICEECPDCLACGEVERCEFRGSYSQVSVRVADSERLVLVKADTAVKLARGKRVGIRALVNDAAKDG